MPPFNSIKIEDMLYPLRVSTLLDLLPGKSPPVFIQLGGGLASAELKSHLSMMPSLECQQFIFFQKKNPWNRGLTTDIILGQELENILREGFKDKINQHILPPSLV